MGSWPALSGDAPDLSYESAGAEFASGTFLHALARRHARASPTSMRVLSAGGARARDAPNPAANRHSGAVGDVFLTNGRGRGDSLSPARTASSRFGRPATA